MAKLIVNPTSSNRREIPLSRTTILTIGRDPSNDLVLPDAMVSRRHAVVEHRGSQFFLRDCSSANGSVVNGDRVSERALRDGDLVAIGSMRLLFREEVGRGGRRQGAGAPSAAPLECPSCKSVYRRGDLFCRECGAQVAQPSGPPKAVCAACGAAVPLPARFCNSCGGTLAPDGQRVEELARARRPADDRSDTQPVPDRVAGALAPRGSGAFAIAARRPARTRPRAAAEAPSRARPRPRSERRRRGNRRAAAAAPREPEPADPGSRLAAFLVDTVFVASGQAVLLAPVGVVLVGARDAAHALGRRAPAGVRLGHAAAARAAAGRALPRLLLEREGRDARQGAAGAARGDGRGRLPDPARERAARAFGYVLSAASLGIGFLMVAFGGRGLHDRIASTRVVKGRRAVSLEAEGSGRASRRRSWRSPADAVPRPQHQTARACASASCAPAGSSSTTCRWRCCSASS